MKRDSPIERHWDTVIYLKKNASGPSDVIEIMDTVIELIQCPESEIDVRNRGLASHVATMRSHLPAGATDPEIVNADWRWIGRWVDDALRAEYVERTDVGDPAGLAETLEGLDSVDSVHDLRDNLRKVSDFMYCLDRVGFVYFTENNHRFVKRLRNDFVAALEGTHRKGIGTPKLTEKGWQRLARLAQSPALEN